MQLNEAKQKFIAAWGTFGSNWGIIRTMAQIHALLLCSIPELSAEQIMEQLEISRGNANMNLRALIDIGLIHKKLKTGDRREYFFAEKNMLKVVRQIIQHRKRKELAPLLEMLEAVKGISEKGSETDEFIGTIDDIQLFAQRTDKLLDIMLEADAEWLLNNFLRFK